MLALLVGLVLSAGAALAAPGDRDTSFDGDGWLRTGVGTTPSASGLIRGLAIQQSDGKLVVAGGNGEDFVVARYNADGGLDSSFGNGGVVRTDIGTDSSDTATSVALQDDGKVVVAGSSEGDFALARYNANGTLDTGFDADGKVTTDLNSESFDTANGVALQPGDDKIVVAGPSSSGGDSDFALARYNTDGSLDTNADADPGTHFDTDGKVVADLGSNSDVANAVAIQGDGKIVVAGQFSNIAGSDFALARFDANGSPDNGFDTDGKLTTDIGTNSFDVASAVTLQGDGKIVAAGTGDGNFALARYNTDGSLDTNADADPGTHFDTDGKVSTDIGTNSFDSAGAMALQADGKIVVAGTTNVGGGTFDFDFALARYNDNGALDTGFDTDGKLNTSFGTVGDSAAAIALQADGKIVAAGGAGTQFALARYGASGSLDTNADSDPETHFDTDGKVTTTVSKDSSDVAQAVAVQEDGKIVVAGSTNAGNGDSDFVLARYHPNGALDSSFGGDGIVTTDIGSGSSDDAMAVVVQPNAKIVAAGGSDGTFALARYDQDGSLDSGFGTGGKLTTPIGASSSANAMALQPDGKILVAGSSSSGGNGDFALARYNANGAPDAGFDTDGQLTTDIGTMTSDAVEAVALQPDGKIVAAGSSEGDFALARYNPNGSLDTNADADPGTHFDTDGILTTDISGDGTSEDIAMGVALQPDGKIVAGGVKGGPDENDFALARYNPSGGLDTGFDTDGTVVTDIGPEGSGAGCEEDCEPNPATDDSATGVVVQPNSKIVAAGYSGDDIALVRYTSGGAADAGFGPGDPQQIGEVVDDLDAGSFDAANAVALQRNGAIVVAGSINDDIVAARYESDPPHSLTVSTAGSGSGTVTAPGIACPGDCAEAYADGMSVSPTAEPASGSTFEAWGGDCSGTSCQLTMDAGRSITATFSLIPEPGPGPQPAPEPGTGPGGGGPPDTRIDEAKVRKRKGKAKFTFTGFGGTGQLGFECSLDDQQFEACTSPKTYKKLDRGKHSFAVRATDSTGQTDPTPDVRQFKSRRR